MSIYSKKLSRNAQIRDDMIRMEEFTVFFRKYYPSLMFYALRFLDEEQAEDIVQDAFMDLWHRRENIEWGDKLGAFMYRSVYTKAINKLKHMSVVNNYSAAVIDINKRKAVYFEPDNNEILRRIESDELGREINKVIETLPDKCREVFKLSYLHDMKNKDIADVLGISVKTVEAHMYKALRLLRNGLSHLILSHG